MNYEVKVQIKRSKIKEIIFCFLTYIIQNQPNSLFLQIIMKFIHTLQIISFSFNDSFIHLWKNEYITKRVNNHLSYFRLFPFFKGDIILYSFGFFLSILMIIIYVSISLYVAFSLYKNNTQKISKFLPTFLAKTYAFFITCMFIPILNSLCSVGNSNNNTLYYCDDIKTNEGLFYVYVEIAVVFGVVLFYYVCIGIYLCYDQIYNKKNISAKQTSTPEIFIIVLNLSNVVFTEILKNEDVFIITYFLLSICIFCSYYSLSHLYNEKMSKVNICGSLIILWNSTCLLFCKIFNKTKFDGGIVLFFCGSVIILFVIIVFYQVEFCITDVTKYQYSSLYGYLHIVKVMDLIRDVEKNVRKAKILLESYIFCYEQSCPLKNCPLTMYGKEVHKGNFNMYSFLLQHIEVRFKRLIDKFPTDTFIRIMFAYFINKKLKKQNYAHSILTVLENQSNTLVNDFLLFRMNVLLEKEENDSVFQSEHIPYSSLFISFKEKILRISKLYINFWSTLFFYHQNSSNDLSRLNDVGFEIERTRLEIDEDFEELQKMRPNNIQVLRYYSDFLSEVINDKESALKYASKIKEIKEETKIDFNNHILDVDLQSISTDEFQYILISTNTQDFGCIMEISLEICSESGYVKNELIGKNLNILVPEIFRGSHHMLLKRKYAEFLQKEIDDKLNNKKQFNSAHTFMLTKARFLVPIVTTPAILTNESNSHFFIARIDTHKDSNSITHATFENNTCYLLTNLSFIIQNYSVEALRLLALDKDDEIDTNNLFLGNFIKDFKSKIIDRKQFTSSFNAKKDVILTWAKKSKLFNVNSEFICNATLVNMSGVPTAYVIKLTLNKQKITKQKNNGNIIQINKNYLPKIENKKTVNYNVEENSFGLNQKEITSEEITAKLREKAMEKISLIKKEKIKKRRANKKDEFSSDDEEIDDKSQLLGQDDESEETEENEDDDDDYDSGSSEYEKNELAPFDSLKSKRDSKTENEIENVNVTKNENVVLTGYYNVSMKGLKFFVYNFEINAIKEMNDHFYLISQVQTRIKEMQEPTMFPKKTQSKIKKHLSAEYQMQEYEKMKKEQDEKIIKQIKYALTKNEAKYSILRLRAINFFIFLFLIGEGIFVFFFFTGVYSQLEEFCLLIQYSFQMLLNCVYSIYFTRELTLLSISEYTITYQDDNEYLKDTVALIKELYEDQQRMTDYIITSSITLSKSAEQQIYEKTYEMYMITDEYDLLSFNITLNAALSQVLGAQFVLSTMTTDDIVPTHKTVYFNFLNSLNGIYTGLLNLADIFEDEMNNKFDMNKIVALVDVVVFLVFGVLFYFVIMKLYVGVVMKKNDYLAVFYEISLDIIRLALSHCETFNQKLMMVTNEESVSISGTLSTDVSDGEMNDITDPIITKKSNSSEVHQSKKSFIHSSSKDILLTRIGIFIVMMISPFGSLLIYIYTTGNFAYFTSNIAIFKANARMNTRYLMLFNILREYIFDKDTYVKYYYLENYFESELSEIINKTINDISTIDKHQFHMKQRFKDLYQEIYYGDICGYSKDFFNEVITEKWRTCQSITFNTSTYGLFILQQFFIDEIKEMKSLVDINEKIALEHNFKYNLTLYNTPKYPTIDPSAPDEEKELYNELNPLRFFNTIKHDNLVIVFKQIYRPLITTMNEALITNNHNSQRTLKLFNTAVVCLYFGLIALIYFFIWRKAEDGLQSTITKAKNMIMLLPKELLVGLESVIKLFDINVNNSSIGSINSNVNMNEEETNEK